MVHRHFTESVPDHISPKVTLEVLHNKAGGERRRSSALAGALVAFTSAGQEESEFGAKVDKRLVRLYK